MAREGKENLLGLLAEKSGWYIRRRTGLLQAGISRTCASQVLPSLGSTPIGETHVARPSLYPAGSIRLLSFRCMRLFSSPRSTSQRQLDPCVRAVSLLCVTPAGSIAARTARRRRPHIQTCEIIDRHLFHVARTYLRYIRRSSTRDNLKAPLPGDELSLVGLGHGRHHPSLGSPLLRFVLYSLS